MPQLQSRMVREQESAGTQRRRVSYRSAAILAGFLILNMTAPWLCTAASSPVPKAIQNLYDKKEYQRALDEVAKLDKEQSAAPDVRRLKTRVLLKLGNPKDAMEEYDKLDASLKQDDIPLLREVALGFIVVMLKDMRDQMRGAAYTALKEVDSDEVVPYFEDGLSDGSGPVRVLAVEGLGRSEAGRKSVNYAVPWKIKPDSSRPVWSKCSEKAVIRLFSHWWKPRQKMS